MKKVCRNCIKKHGLLENMQKFTKNECTYCGKIAFCQGGRHRVWRFDAFFDNAVPKIVIRRGVKYV